MHCIVELSSTVPGSKSIFLELDTIDPSLVVPDFRDSPEAKFPILDLTFRDLGLELWSRT